MNGKAEKIMRILTLPPLVAILTAGLLWGGGGNGGNTFGAFHGIASGATSGLTCGEFVAAAVLLGLVPLLAYPLWELFPNGDDRRSGQRTYALYCSIAGYAIGFVWSMIGSHSPEIKVLFSSYILSVVVLILLNKLARFKASGHACSSTAPLVLITWKLGVAVAPLGLLILVAVYYSSLRLGRHTLAQLLTGSGVSLAAGMGCIRLLGAI